MAEESHEPVVTMVPAQWRELASLLVRVGVWGSLFAAIYILRSFFLLIFLTFVFAYLQSRMVDRLRTRIRSRTLRVVISGLVFLALILGVGRFMLPAFRQQAQVFLNNFTVYLKTFDSELIALSKQSPVLAFVVPEIKDAAESGADAAWDIRKSPSAALLQPLLGFDESVTPSDNLKGLVDTLKDVGAGVVGAISAFLLSLLFSFLIVLDLPRLTEGVRGLANTKLAFIYTEAAGTIYNFGRVLGRALEAQFFIALVNTALTAVGLWILGVHEKTAFLSLIVFLCSFIPIAGVFISSVPICLLALQVGGVSLTLMAIALITVIHLIEAYILNPRIFGHHLRVNPVLVLIILTIGGKLFGVWGLVLGLPMCTYIFRHAIQYAPQAKVS